MPTSLVEENMKHKPHPMTTTADDWMPIDRLLHSTGKVSAHKRSLRHVLNTSDFSQPVSHSTITGPWVSALWKSPNFEAHRKDPLQEGEKTSTLICENLTKVWAKKAISTAFCHINWHISDIKGNILMGHLQKVTMWEEIDLINANWRPWRKNA